MKYHPKFKYFFTFLCYIMKKTSHKLHIIVLITKSMSFLIKEISLDI